MYEAEIMKKRRRGRPAKPLISPGGQKATLVEGKEGS